MFYSIFSNFNTTTINCMAQPVQLTESKNSVFGDPALLEQISDLMLFGKISKNKLLNSDKCIYLSFWRFTIKLLFNNIGLLIIILLLCVIEIVDFMLESNNSQTKEKIMNNFINEMIDEKKEKDKQGMTIFAPITFIMKYLDKFSINGVLEKEAKEKIIIGDAKFQQKYPSSNNKAEKYRKFAFRAGIAQIIIITSRIHNTFASKSAAKTLQVILDESYVAAYENKEALFQSVYTLNKYLSQMGDVCLIFLYCIFNAYHICKLSLSLASDYTSGNINISISFTNNFYYTYNFFQIIILCFLFGRKVIYIFFISKIKPGNIRTVCEYPKSSYLEMYISMTHLLRNRQNYKNIKIVNYTPPSVHLFFFLDTIATLVKIMILICIVVLGVFLINDYNQQLGQAIFDNNTFSMNEFYIVLIASLIKKIAIEEVLSIKEEDFLNILQAFIIISNIPILDQRKRYTLPPECKVLSIEFENTEIGFLKKNNFIRILDIDYMSIKSGKITGISGRSGGGKTTIFLLFLSEAAAIGGKISLRFEYKNKIYKLPIKKIKKKSLNEHLIVCRQNNRFDKNILVEKLISDLYPKIPTEVVRDLFKIFCLDISVLKQHTGYRGVLLDQNTKNALGALLSFLEYLIKPNSTLFFDEHVDRIIDKNHMFFEELKELRISFYKKYKNITLINPELSIVIINHSKEVQQNCDEHIIIKNGTASNFIGDLG